MKTFVLMKCKRITLITIPSLTLLTYSLSAQWLQTPGLDSAIVNCLAVVPSAASSSGSIIFAGTSAGAGVFRTSDQGSTWDSVNVGLTNKQVYGLLAFPASASTPQIELFAATQKGVFRSVDTGILWTAADSGLPCSTGLPSPFSWAIAACMPDARSADTTLFVGTDWGLYRSSNKGAEWFHIDGGPPYTVYAIAIDDSVILACGPNYIYRSSDRGTTWTQVLYYSNYTFICLAFSGQHAFAGDGGSVFHSTYPDTSWEPFNTGIPVARGPVTAFVTWDSTVFAGIWSNGVYRRSLMDTSWIPASDGLYGTGLRVNALSIAWSNTTPGGGQMFAGTDGGVWHRPLSEMIVSTQGDDEMIPIGFELMQNFPNPFNPNTTIGYQLPLSAHVTLRVYDILGREIETLIDKDEVAGTHSTSFNASKLASGIYFYVLRSGGFFAARRFVLLK